MPSDRSVSSTRRRILTTALGASLTAFSGCISESDIAGPERTSPAQTEPPDTESQPDSWPQFGANPRNTGRAGNVTGPGSENAQVSWTFDGGTPTMNTSPVVGNGLVYVGGSGDPGLVHAIEIESGEQRWEFEPAGYLSSAPALVDGTLYFGTWGKQFYALDAESGDVLWNKEIGHRFGSSSPAVVDGTVYVGSYGDGPLVVSGSEDEEEFEAPAMFALDAESGEIQWRYDQFGDRSQIGSSPAVADDRVYFGAEETLYALASETGDEVWTRTVPSHPDSSPAVVDGTVYYGGPTLSDSGPPAQLTALDAASGDTDWTEGLDDISFRSSPAVGDGTVYVAASSRRVCMGGGGDGESDCSGMTRGRMYAIDVESGERQWTAEIKTDTRSSPAVVDNVVYVGCRDGLSAVTTDGENAWRINFEGDREDGPYVDSSPAVADGHVFIGASDGQLRGINADSRQERLEQN